MTHKFFILSVMTMALAVLTAPAHAQIVVIANVADAGEIYAGEPFQYQLIIDGYNQPGTPDLSPLDGFSPKFVGGQNISQTSISIINNRRQTTVVRRYVMAYELTAENPGRLHLPAINVDVQGRIYTTAPITVTVRALATSENLDLEVTLSQSQCYLGQPITMTVRWYVANNWVENIADYNFNIPVLTDTARFLVEPAQPSADSTLQIDLPSGPVSARQTRTTHNGQQSLLVSFDVILIPRRAGTLELPSATLATKIDVTRRSRRSRFFNSRREYKRFLVTAKPITLNVLPLPAADRPADFTGLVGRYRITAAATPTEVHIGDPITLTVTIAGDLLKRVTAPDLQAVTAFAENFKIPSEQASPKLTRVGKVYTQTIRAKNDKITEIPPIPLSYFDVDKGAYVTVHSNPIPLTVSPTRIVTADQAVGGSGAPRISRLQQIKTGLAANYEGPDLLTNVAFSPAVALTQPAHLVLLGAPLALFIIAVVTRLARRTNPVRQAARRRAAACRNAATALKRTSDPTQIATALRQYIADRYDHTAGSLTADDCTALLRRDRKPDDLIAQFSRILDTCDQARYGRSIDNAQAGQTREIIALLKRLQ